MPGQSRILCRYRQLGAFFRRGLMRFLLLAVTVLLVRACLPERTALANNEPTGCPAN